MRFALIDGAKAQFPVHRLRHVLGVSQSGYFAWRGRLACRRQRDDMVLLAHVRSAFTLSNGTYGSPRMTRELWDSGLTVGRRRIARLMRDNGLRAWQKRRFKRTTDSHHAWPVAPNLLDQDFTATGPDKKWGADISFVWTREGWLYLAVVIDLFARRVVGWATGDRLHRDLALAALRKALALRRPAAGLIHHSDRGSQGEFKRSSQHLDEGGCDEQSKATFGSVRESTIAVTWSATGGWTISRELRRNAATRSGGLEYRATTAQWHAERSARRPKQAKLVLNAALRTYVEERLAGVVVAPSGASVPGPAVSWKGRRHGPRQDRRWARAWSPEQIAGRLPVDFPDDETMRISHEAIYQALFVQTRGALRRELTACLRTGRVLRMPRARTRRRGKTFISPEIMIAQRPAEVADRAVPGHWEGDLILGLGSSAIGTLVERTTRFTMLLHLPRLAGHGSAPRMKNGPALAGHGAEAVRDAIARTILTLPEQLRRSLTWDQGAEMAQHARLKIDAGVQVYFCDPQRPWQRGTNENTNGLLRQYFPKGTDLCMHSAQEIAAVAAALNARPRKTLNWRTPAEALDQWLP